MRYARRARLEQRWSLAAVGTQTGIHKSELSKFERGLIGMGLNNLIKVARLYGISIEQLVAEDVAA